MANAFTMPAEDYARAMALDRGAPYGRPGHATPTAAPLRLLLSRLRLNGGGYDSGGTYWGHGMPIFQFRTVAGGYYGTLRARDRDAAKDVVRQIYPAAIFFG